MKIIERAKVPKKKYGKVIFGNQNLENHEISTVFRLSSFGFDVETVPPTDMPNSNSPDLVMMGTYWEMKRPQNFNKDTINKRLRKGKKQSGGRIVFDLRDLKNDMIDKATEYIIELFKATRGLNRTIIIISDDKLLYKFKHILDSGE